MTIPIRGNRVALLDDAARDMIASTRSRPIDPTGFRIAPRPEVPTSMKPVHMQLPELTGLRGVAAMLVVVSHLNGMTYSVAKPLHLGELGVMTFFSLSGFLMSLLYASKPFSFVAARDYIGARFARIAPAYLFVVCASYLICNFLDPHFVYPLNNHNIVRHLLFSGNQAVFWSVPPEIQFYALFIVIWFALDAFLRGHRARWLVLVFAICVVLIVNRQRFPGTIVGSTLHFFLFGALAGHLRSRMMRFPLKPLGLTICQLAPLVLLGLLAFDVLDLGFASNEEVYASLPNALFAASVVFLYSFSTTWSRIVLAQPVLLLCGACSFSIYLLHEPLIYWARPALPVAGPVLFTVGVLLLIVLVSFVTFRVIELPGNRGIKAGLAKLGRSGRYRPDEVVPKT